MSQTRTRPPVTSLAGGDFRVVSDDDPQPTAVASTVARTILIAGDLR